MRHVYVFLALFALSATTHAQTRYEWIGGGEGDWNDPANWSPNGVPAAADTAVVGEEGQGTRIATLTETTIVAGFELIRLGGIDGDFDLTVTDRLIWGGGGTGFDPIRGSGTVTIGSAAVLRVTEDAGRFRVGPDRMIVNEGLLLWEAPVRWDGEGRFVNEGTLDLAFDGPDGFNFVFSSLADAFTNTSTGVIRRTESGDARYTAGLVNDGLIRVETGSLDLRGFNSTGTTGGGSIDVESGGTLIIGSGNHTQPSVTGDAVTFAFGNGRLTVTDTYDVTTTRFESGNGRLVLNTDGTTGTLFMESGTIDGSGTLTVTDSFEWAGGRMEGSGTTILGPSVPLTIGAANVSLSGTRTLRTGGPVTWTGDANLSSGTTTTVFENAGTLTSSGAGERRVNFLTFRNTGTLVHESGTLDFQTRMDNEGEVRAEGGTLQLRSSGSVDTGRYTVAEAGLLSIEGSRTFTETVLVEGAGTVAFISGTVTNRATWRPGTSPGILSVDSNWPSPASESVLDMEISGPSPGTDFDQLAVTGTANLGGTLRVTLTDGFEPADGDRFLLIPAAAVSGSFDALDLPGGLDAFIEATDEGVEFVIGQPVANEDDGAETLPSDFALDRAYPNPFADQTMVRYAVPESGRVRLTVFDVLGRTVATLVDEERAAGRYEAVFDGQALPSGVYLVRMTADGFQQTRRVTLLR